MFHAPTYQVSTEEIQHFQAALTHHDPTLLPPQTPKWVFLCWLAEWGYWIQTAQHPYPHRHLGLDRRKG